MTKQILTTTILFLSLGTYAAAQNRSPKEALEGLREIGVNVKFGDANGLEAATQPAILQMLQDRAKDRLREAEVPVLRSSDEANMAGKPRLVFTVTANKPSTDAVTIRVESRLYERVRLWRDRAKEIELATWVQSGIGVGSTLSHEMLFQVFDGQLNEFIRDYREGNPNPARVTNAGPTLDTAAQLSADGNFLQGLNGVDLFVWSGPTRFLDPPLEALVKTLQGEAEKKFKQAGIPLLKYAQETEAAGRPLLYVSIKLNQPNSHAPAIAIESEFWQRVRPVRDPKKDTYAVTWESQTANGGPINDEAVLQLVNSQLDEFIKAYKAANPKQSSAANVKAQ